MRISDWSSDVCSSDLCLERIRKAAALAGDLGLECHAGHGLTFDTVGPVAVIPTIAELNIGHFLIGEAIFSGLDRAIRRMRLLLNKVRAHEGRARRACQIGSASCWESGCQYVLTPVVAGY